MSEVNQHENESACAKCGATVSARDTNGLCPACLLAEVIQPSAAVMTPEELAPRFPGYEVLRLLGRGGMGAVYLARQISLSRLVAIKILPADLDDGENHFMERFKNEAEAMARLTHPGIVAVHDFGQTTDGLLFIIMEYVDGTDVQMMLMGQGRLHSAQAMAITAHVCDALAYAHSKGIVHRDIKPSNIMISHEGQVKVADFGLAKVEWRGGSTGLTQSGLAMGTPHFIAPESLAPGVEVDQRADIYAVGVMLYQMLTGKLPQGLFEMPSLQVPGLDPRYDRIIARALREDREARYQDAVEMRRDLDAILTQPVERATGDGRTVPVTHLARRQQRPPAPASRSKSKVTPIIGILGAAALAVAAFIALLGPGFVTEKRAAETLEAPKAQVERDSSDAKAFDEPGSTSVERSTARLLAEATKASPFVNSLGMRFVPVPITGGTTDGQLVLFCVHETRAQDYEAFLKGVKHEAPPSPPFSQGPDHPVVNVNWQDAISFCSWLTSAEKAAGRLPAGHEYRLPGDHEWSCAVGIGEQENPSSAPDEKSNKVPRSFPWGTSWPPPSGAGNYADQSRHSSSAGQNHIVGYNDGFPDTAPVMSFSANALGLYDLGGNVFEMVHDWSDDQMRSRVARGGSFVSGASQFDMMLSSARIGKSSRMVSSTVGFRCVLAPVATPTASLATKAPARPQAVSMPDNPTAVGPKLSSAVSVPSLQKPYANSLGMRFVPVPITGGPTDGQSVLFCVHETRVQDYEAFAKDTNRKVPRPSIIQNSDHPVVEVSWGEAMQFCAWLTVRETTTGSLPSGLEYRLPSDHEWSCAVGIGTKESPSDHPNDKLNSAPWVFPWGTSWPPPAASGNYSDQSRKKHRFHSNEFYLEQFDDGFADTAPVMSFKPNKLGLYDLGGNVWEMVMDWSDPTKRTRAARGAAYTNAASPSHLFSSARSSNPPEHRHPSFGFRSVLAQTARPTAFNDSSSTPTSAASAAPQSSPATAGLLEQYSNAITRAAASAAETHKPAFEAEIARLKSGGALPPEAEDARLPVELKRLRGILRSQLKSQPVGDPASASKESPFVNTLGMKFVPVSGVKVLMCAHETRRQDYAVYARSAPGIAPDWQNQVESGIPCGGEDAHPVVGVSWNEAQAFCKWLSKKEGKTYRLPTDQEWSHAVGIDREEKWSEYTTPEMLNCKVINKFPWGGEFPPKTKDQAGNYGDSALKGKFPAKPFIEGYADGFPTTAPVMSFKPNSQGFYDLGGNVSEWVEDWWNAAKVDRVLRGASWIHSSSGVLLSSGRFRNAPGNRGPLDGFRVVLESSAYDATAAASPPSPAPVISTKGNFTNTLGMQFVPVPDTTVLFCIHETRYKDYSAFAAQAPGVDDSWKNQTCYGCTIAGSSADHPVTKVSWEDAQKFCSWLSQKEGRAYRLPTDREWSIAVGLGPDEKWTADTTPANVFKSRSAFPWGTIWPLPNGAGNYADGSRKARAPSPNAQYLDGYEDGFPTTAPVMSFRPNQVGLYDMGGNVWEWVADWYDPMKLHRTFRGGSFVMAHRDYLLSSYRSHNPPGYRHDNHGFRVVLEVTNP